MNGFRNAPLFEKGLAVTHTSICHNPSIMNWDTPLILWYLKQLKISIDRVKIIDKNYVPFRSPIIQKHLEWNWQYNDPLLIKDFSAKLFYSTFLESVVPKSAYILSKDIPTQSPVIPIGMMSYPFHKKIFSNSNYFLNLS